MKTYMISMPILGFLTVLSQFSKKEIKPTSSSDCAFQNITFLDHVFGFLYKISLV